MGVREGKRIVVPSSLKFLNQQNSKPPTLPQIDALMFHSMNNLIPKKGNWKLLAGKGGGVGGVLISYRTINIPCRHLLFNVNLTVDPFNYTAFAGE